MSEWRHGFWWGWSTAVVGVMIALVVVRAVG